MGSDSSGIGRKDSYPIQSRCQAPALDDVDFGQNYNAAWRNAGMLEKVKCPRCGRVIEAHMSYCPCGQAIAATGDSTVYSPSGDSMNARVEQGTLRSEWARTPGLEPVKVNSRPVRESSQDAVTEPEAKRRKRSHSVVVGLSVVAVIVAISVFAIVFAGRSCNSAIVANSTWESWGLVDTGKRFTCNADTKIAVVGVDGALLDHFFIDIYAQGESDAVGKNRVSGGHFQIRALVDNDGEMLEEGWYVFRIQDENGKEVCELDVDYDESANAPEGVRVECS